MLEDSPVDATAEEDGQENKDGKMHGQGTYTYADGGKYVGAWKDGKKHGQGTQTNNADGTSWTGEWENDKKKE